jgi:amidohydrolase
MPADITQAVNKLEPELIALRRTFHRHPELGLQEQWTANRVAEELERIGLPVKRNVGRTGLVADLAGAGEGPTLLLRSDMDGLPVKEVAGHDFASKNDGVMHACGHDAHMASLLGAAKILSEHQHRIRGRVRFCFQPAEEIIAGAALMIEDGVMDGVDEVLAAHVLTPAPFGVVLARPGPFFAGCDIFELRIIGKAGHGAMPHLSVDPIIAGAHVITALQTIVSRETKPGETLVVSVAAIEGGKAANVVVEEVVLRGTVRWFVETERDRVLERMGAIAQGVASALRAKTELRITGSVPVTQNTAASVSRAAAAIAATGRAGMVDSGPITASEDFSLFLKHAPGCLIGVGAGGPDAPPHHHHSFTVDERAIALTAEVFVRYTLDALA